MTYVRKECVPKMLDVDQKTRSKIYIWTIAIFITMVWVISIAWVFFNLKRETNIGVTPIMAESKLVFDGMGTGKGDEAQFTVILDVTAKNGNVYVPMNKAIGYDIVKGSVELVAVEEFNSSEAESADSFFLVREGETESLALVLYVTATGGTADFVSVGVNSIQWTPDPDEPVRSYTGNVWGFDTEIVYLVPR